MATDCVKRVVICTSPKVFPEGKVMDYLPRVAQNSDLVILIELWNERNEMYLPPRRLKELKATRNVKVLRYRLVASDMLRAMSDFTNWLKHFGISVKTTRFTNYKAVHPALFVADDFVLHKYPTTLYFIASEADLLDSGVLRLPAETEDLAWDLT